ncbi:hypothetical protein HYT57_01355 [Candidatus Woesearchaeota archaeon]|nr:hypothetical protein [Candidatus Woesearchaeota archaeon]
MTNEYVYKKVGSIVFGLLSPRTAKKMASVKIVTPELYDKEGYPVDGGLMDVRLGVIDPGLRCKTCNSKLKECPGHFGYMDLARPVIHIKYIKQILNFLKYSCRECGKVLAMKEDLKGKGIKGFKTLKDLSKCPHCQAKQFKVKFEKPSSYVENDVRLSPIEIRARLEKISDEDVKLFGYNAEYARPEWMILTLLPIPPVTVRPSITLESGERSEDDLTHKLGDIVRINQRLFENINAGAPEIIIEDLWDLLQYHITTYFDNEISQVPPARHRSGQPLKTLSERIKSKEGRFRYNLAGKRVNYAARTVISPDPKIKFNEVGIPKSVAMELTVPERATSWNIEWLKELITNGPKKYVGANYVITLDNKKKKITEETKEQILADLTLGCIVERHLIQGDVCVFNRQPSLHRMSIMCHKIVILPGKSFRLNPGVCVAPDTLVQLSSGIQRPIDELKNCWKESELATYDEKRKKIIKTELKKFWGLKPEEYGARCYEIKTKSGRKVTATGDHPFYTAEGLKEAKRLTNNDKLILRPLDTPVYKEMEKELVSEDDIRWVAPKETYLKHAINVLSDLKLLPLNLKDQRVMTISRLLGHLFGDGTFILKKDTARLIFRGKKKDLEMIQKDIESLGFKPEKIYVKTVENKIVTVKGKKLIIKGSGHDFEVRNKPLALLFAALEAPNGDKAKLCYGVPKWIKRGPDYIQREFLASYFGSELTKLKIRDSSATSLRSLVFKISKVQSIFNYAKLFIDDISGLLSRFDVRIGFIKEEDGNIRKDGSITKTAIASINDKVSIRNLLGKIGYIYDMEKDNIARLAYQYLLEKEKQIGKRKDDYNEIVQLFKKHKSVKKILEIKPGYTRGQIEFWVYNKKKLVPGLQNDFVGFDDWVVKNANKINGFVYDRIESIKETYVPFVYDVTTTEPTHNFFVNGFLSSNCTPYNADFDGDEMNLHIPQTEESRAEAEILMQVQSHIITPKNGYNVVGCTNDAITGNYLLTNGLTFTKEEAVQMLYSIGVTEFGILKNKEVDGKDVFSALLPRDFDFIGNSKDGRAVKVERGRLIEGFIDKSTIGEDNGTLIRALYAKYGEDIGIDLLGKLFRLGIAVLLRNGFTTSISDTDLPENVVSRNKELTLQTEKKVEELIQQYKEGKLEPMPALTPEETLEKLILQNLNGLRNKIGETVFEHIKLWDSKL